MGFGDKLNNLLEYKIDLQTRLSWKSALIIIVIFSILLLGAVQKINEKFFTVNEKSIFERQIEAFENFSAQSVNSTDKVQLALAYYLDGDYDEAEDIYQDILRDDKNNGLANMYYGLILADQSKYKEAVPYLEKAIKLVPIQAKLAYESLGVCYYKLGNYAQAAKVLEISIRIGADSPVNYYYLGLTNKQRGNNVRAKAMLQQAIKLSGGEYPEAAKALQELKK